MYFVWKSHRQPCMLPLPLHVGHTSSSIWHVVWCGVVWFGVVWCAVLWCGVVWCCVVCVVLCGVCVCGVYVCCYVLCVCMCVWCVCGVVCGMCVCVCVVVSVTVKWALLSSSYIYRPSSWSEPISSPSLPGSWYGDFCHHLGAGDWCHSISPHHHNSFQYVLVCMKHKTTSEWLMHGGVYYHLMCVQASGDRVGYCMHPFSYSWPHPWPVNLKCSSANLCTISPCAFPYLPPSSI